MPILDRIALRVKYHIGDSVSTELLPPQNRQPRLMHWLESASSMEHTQLLKIHVGRPC